MKRRNRTFMIVVIALVVLVLWVAFCGFWWGWGPFAKLHAVRTASHPGNAPQYGLKNVQKREGSPLEGKRILFLGSSITYGTASGGVSFADYIGARNGCTVIKRALSGTTLADDGFLSYVPRLKQVSRKRQVDLFVCQLSTNDAWKNKPLGTVSTSDVYDTSTVAGAIEYIIRYAQETWGCPVVFYTNPPFDDARYGEMVELLHTIAEKWDITVIDMWSDEAFNRITDERRTLYMADHTHPTRVGYLLWWTPYIESYLYAALDT